MSHKIDGLYALHPVKWISSAKLHLAQLIHFAGQCLLLALVSSSVHLTADFTSLFPSSLVLSLPAISSYTLMEQAGPGDSRPYIKPQASGEFSIRFPTKIQLPQNRFIAGKCSCAVHIIASRYLSHQPDGGFGLLGLPSPPVLAGGSPKNSRPPSIVQQSQGRALCPVIKQRHSHLVLQNRIFLRFFLLKF